MVVTCSTDFQNKKILNINGRKYLMVVMGCGSSLVFLALSRVISNVCKAWG